MLIGLMFRCGRRQVALKRSRLLYRYKDTKSFGVTKQKRGFLGFYKKKYAFFAIWAFVLRAFLSFGPLRNAPCAEPKGIRKKWCWCKSFPRALAINYIEKDGCCSAAARQCSAAAAESFSAVS